MSRPECVVLKFGGSVLLPHTTRFPLALEAYRHWRLGQAVCVVVSAIFGRTEALLKTAPAGTDFDRAAWLANGEREAAAELAEAFAAIGLPVKVLDPLDFGLRAEGPPLGARLTGGDFAALREALSEGAIGIVPGFFAADDRGRVVTLGRGGSDQTALALGIGLKATQCILVKAVDGLFTEDPEDAKSPLKRYRRADPRALLGRVGKAIQNEALELAARADYPFDVRGLLAEGGTRVQAGPTVLEPLSASAKAPLRVALLGHGTVGSAVLAARAAWPKGLALQSILVRDPSRHRLRVAPDLAPLLTKDPLRVFAQAPDLVIELLGDLEPAASLAARALAAGADLVTANKALLAARGEALFAGARAAQRSVYCSAAVGGALPVLETLLRERPAQLRASWNGTANAILGAERAGLSFAEALEQAIAMGFAERDPSRDLDGRDAFDKAVICAKALWPEQPIGEFTPLVWPNSPPAPGLRYAQIATLGANEPPRVAFEALSADDPLFALEGPMAAISFESGGVRRCLKAAGAGGPATALSVLADLHDAALARRANAGATESPWPARGIPLPLGGGR